MGAKPPLLERSMANKKTEEMLSDVIADNLNKLFKDKDQVAYIGEEDSHRFN